MKKYEFRSITVYPKDMLHLSLIDILNEYGQEGWQLVDFQDMSNPSYVAMILQREIK